MTLKEATQLLEEVTKRINAGDRRWCDSFYSPTALFRGSGVDVGLDDARKWWAAMWTAFPDLRFRGEVILVGEDGFAQHWVMSGTQTGPYLGMPPTGKHFEICGVTAFRMRGGKVTEEWAAFDNLRLRVQLGLLPNLG
jgi:predicted ester cyclase